MLRSLRFQSLSRRALVVLVAVVAAAGLLAASVTFESRDRPAGGSASTSTAPEGGGFVGGVDESTDASSALRAGAAPDAVLREKTESDAFAADVTPSAGTDSPLAAAELDARIVRTASIRLDVKRRSFEDAWSDAQAAATSRGGYVVAASRSGAGDDARTGTITMRVPTQRFEGALDDLRAIDGVKVDGLDVTSQDVTQEYVDTKSRLRHDRAVESRLMTLLADADGVSEVLAVQARLDSVQEQIEVARGRLQYLDKLTAMSTIELTLRAPAKGGSSSDEDPGMLATAFSDAGERFVDNVAGAIVWAGGVLPGALMLAAIAATTWATLRRRRRNSASEQAID